MARAYACSLNKLLGLAVDLHIGNYEVVEVVQRLVVELLLRTYDGAAVFFVPLASHETLGVNLKHTADHLRKTF